MTAKDGSKFNLTVRVTDCYRKLNGQWLITQEHVSVPVDLNTGKPDLASKPSKRRKEYFLECLPKFLLNRGFLSIAFFAGSARRTQRSQPLPKIRMAFFAKSMSAKRISTRFSKRCRAPNKASTARCTLSITAHKELYKGCIKIHALCCRSPGMERFRVPSALSVIR
jgi:hypothetical protein